MVLCCEVPDTLCMPGVISELGQADQHLLQQKAVFVGLKLIQTGLAALMTLGAKPVPLFGQQTQVYNLRDQSTFSTSPDTMG